MKRLFALTLVIAFVGCSHESAAPRSASQKTIEKTTTLVDSGSHSPTDETEDRNYPEKADVIRLLVRANSLESKGEFEDALALADQAVSIDPNSPKANAMKARLEELLRRV